MRPALFALVLLAACAPPTTSVDGSDWGAPDAATCAAPCNGTCCAPGQSCDPATKTCRAPCIASCTNRGCGNDGCGGSCGTCAAGTRCDSSGLCVPCSPQCAGRTCGDDSCGGSCGTCTAAGATCTSSGTCCTRQCAGRNCGPDGCGGTCGSCSVGESCVGSVCRASSTDAGTPDAAVAPDASTPAVSFCQEGCASAQDCVVANQPLYSEPHWSCDGLCHWKGCFSDAECQTTFNSSKYGCHLATGAAVKTCEPTCIAAKDCALSTAGAYSEAHWTCDGSCHWKGCATDGECQQTFNAPNYACRAPSGGGVPLCLQTCAAAKDCAIANQPLYDAAHWTCDGTCHWLGCATDPECASTFGASYVCR